MPQYAHATTPCIDLDLPVTCDPKSPDYRPDFLLGFKLQPKPPHPDRLGDDLTDIIKRQGNVKTEFKQELIYHLQTFSSRPIPRRTCKALQTKKIPREERSSICEQLVFF
ncbi:hypothetical protein CHS0354_037309 [Potamilus streckersoni]|uniref:Uncharacterized protein n=1 Tax=Potamilus streckersoni TaxID=2493646 RepID=A0AAE0WGF8_9BIVA|nr:hypothetical protein CHS0354_037309 [Potamilus streckersoni]